MHKTEEEQYPYMIIFFDGYCHLCSSVVDFLVRVDKKRVFRYAPISSDIGQQLVAEQSKNVDSILLYNNGVVTTKSEAIMEILKHLAWPWRVFYVFRFFPKGLMDVVYDFIAKTRHKVFRKRTTCRIPNEDERALFLS